MSIGCKSRRRAAPVDHRRPVMRGEGRWARYRLPQAQAAVDTAAEPAEARAEGEAVPPLFEPDAEIQAYVRKQAG
ncbi:MAG: hypothetical protein EOS34_32435 [Mesorhizobium sp.]|uniref:hypothetical protein n=1 Tax=Mesorhizobium sp. TaxID=1871066 RepID=UPI000FE69A76|nr:hypothetical protein [Mesorhizobium sp.]RWD27064.1 MAG: hypothetical protein EOS34_32435 [Mesorhizobium sp.]RWI63320.1 MAG: hypothetical protein EOR18_31645 [Mesorhizobium sp.]